MGSDLSPLVITLWVLNLIVSTMDQTLQLLPANLQPELLLGRRIPGVGVVLTLVVIQLLYFLYLSHNSYNKFLHCFQIF